MTTEQEALRLAEEGERRSKILRQEPPDWSAMLRKLVAERAECERQYQVKVEEIIRLEAEREEYRAAMRRALEAMVPVSAYGRVGSRDVEQAALQSAITHLRQRLEGTT